MPSRVNSPSLRVAIAVGFYLGLVVVASLFFSWTRQGPIDGSVVRYVHVLCGPALALFTHMSYLLFGLQSLLLIPWLLIAALWTHAKAKVVGIVGFSISWLAIGWKMSDLF